MTTLRQISNWHKLLRRCRYYYYIKAESLINDFEYDKLEKKYTELCNKEKIPEQVRITNFIGFDIGIPMDIIKASNLYVINQGNKK